MAGRIPNDAIQTVLSQIDIVQLIQTRLTLKKSGQNWSACCPFHNEKTPSFIVSAQKQFYHCFGCGAHGNAIGFLIAYDRMSFPEAVEALAEQAGVALPTDEVNSNQDAQQYQALLDIMTQAQRYYQTQLHRNPTALAYLEQRGLSPDTIKTFGLGYAPEAWRSLQARIDAHPAQLVTAGLTIHKPGKRDYDRFRDRLMFPIRDRRGRTIAFGGRTLGEASPKYLNSPETPLFHKSQTLYGIDQLTTLQPRPKKIILVEGYMDVIMLAEHGIQNACATLGTALTPRHFQRLTTLCNHLAFCFDGDSAGLAAADRAVTLCLPLLRDGLSVDIITLPKGHDPDSFVAKQGKLGFEDAIQTAKPLHVYLFAQIEQTYPLISMGNRIRYALEAKRHITRIPGQVYQQLLLAQLAERTQLTGAQIEQLSPEDLPGERPQHLAIQKLKPNNARLNPIQTAFSILIQYPHLNSNLPKMPDDLYPKSVAYQQLRVLQTHCEQQPTPTTAQLSEYWRDHPLAKRVQHLITYTHLIQTDTALAQELADTGKKIIRDGRQQLIDQLLDQAQQGTLSTANKQRLLALLSQKSNDTAS